MAGCSELQSTKKHTLMIQKQTLEFQMILCMNTIFVSDAWLLDKKSQFVDQRSLTISTRKVCSGRTWSECATVCQVPPSVHSVHLWSLVMCPVSSVVCHDHRMTTTASHTQLKIFHLRGFYANFYCRKNIVTIFTVLHYFTSI